MRRICGREKVNRSANALGFQMARLLAGFTLAAAVGLFLACNPFANVGWGDLTIQIGTPDAKMIAPGIG